MLFSGELTNKSPSGKYKFDKQIFPPIKPNCVSIIGVLT